MALTLTFILLLTAICSLIIMKHLQKLHYWKRHKVDTISVWYVIKRARKVHLYQVIQEIYEQMCVEQKPIKVIEAWLTSAMIVQDQEAIKEVLTTKFENFPDRGFYVNPRDPLLANLGRFHYDVWKPLKRKLTPAFSPAKLRYMFPTLAEVGQHFVQVLEQHVERGDQVLEMHDLCKRFAIDVIGTAAFGIECNSLNEPKTEFKIQGEKAVSQQFRPFFDQFAEKHSGFLNFINYKYHSKEPRDFFTNMVKETVEFRERNNVKRQDFLDILIELRNEGGGKNGEECSLNMEMMVGQVFLFFVAGYESNSSALCEALYELAKNPGVQEKARLEASQVRAQFGNEITYQSLREMKYIKQIILETLRKYPIVHGLTRYCRQQCTLSTAKGPVVVPRETTVIIPAYAIHYNPQFYPNPHAFSPERFEDQEMARRVPYTFLTFGEGPRGCLAAGFGVMELTFGLAALLSHFRFSVTIETPQEVEFDRNIMYHLSIKNDIYLKVDKL